MGTTAAFTSAGSKLYVSSTAPATLDAAGYEALTWTQVKEITSFGAIGRTYQDITHSPVDSRQTHHFKGGFDDGGLQLEMAKTYPVDAGQAIVATALDDDADYYWKLEFNNNPGGTSNEIWYVPAKVMASPTNVGDTNSLTTLSTNIMLNGDTVVVAAVV